MNTERIKQIYDAMSRKYDMEKDLDAFTASMNDTNYVRKVYDAMSRKYDMEKDYDEFLESLGITPSDGLTSEVLPEEAKANTDSINQFLENRDTLYAGLQDYDTGVVSGAEQRRRDNATAEAEAQAEAVRQRLQEDGTIDRMKEMRREARRSKLANLGLMALNSAGGATSVTGGSVGAELPNNVDVDVTEAAEQYRQNKLLQERLDVTLDMARAGENQDGLRGLENLGLGLWDSATRLSTWDFGVSDITNNLTLMQIAEKWENDPSSLTATEKMVLDGIGMATAVQELYADQVGIGYNVGQSLPESAGFMASMALNPASGLGKSLARNAVRTYGRNSIAKNLARIGGDIAETAIMTATTGAGRVAADALERINGSSTYEIGENGVIMYGGQKDQEAVGSAVIKAIGSNFIENYSEALGEYFDPLLGMSRKIAAGGLRKMHLNKWADALSDVQPSQMTASIRALREKTKFGGIFGEIMEEEIGMALNAITVGDYTFSKEEADASKGKKQWIFNLENQLTTVLSCAIMSGTLNGVEQVSNVAARRRMEKNTKNAEQEALYRFGSKKFDPLREAIDQASPEGMVDVLRDVYMSQEYTVGQKRALAEYAAARLQLQYYNAADAKARRQVNKTQQELLDAQEAGLNAQLPQFYNIGRAAQYAEEDLLDYDGDWNLIDIVRSAMSRPEEMERILGDIPPREAELVKNYIYTRARMEGAYQGRSNRVEDYIDDVAYALEPAVVTDADGNRTITTAILGDRSVYVLENNGDLAHIMRPDGSKTLVKASELTNITTSSAEDVMERYRSMYAFEYDAETENAFEHHPKTQAPQVGLQLQSPEGEVVITAVNDNMVEIVPAVYKDGQVQPKEGAEPKTITVDDAYAWQDDYYLSMDADQAYANAMAEASNISEETADNEGTPVGEIEQGVSEEVTDGQIAATVLQPTETESVAPVAPAAPQTARERVPKDKKGNPIYEQTDADTAWDAIVEETEGNVEMAQSVAEQMLANKKAALEKLQKGKAKAGANVAQIIANEKAHQEAIAKAEADVKAWERIAQVNVMRQQKVELERAEADRAAAEQRRAEEARILAEQEEQARREREELQGVPDMVDDTPQDARARGYRRVNGHKVDRQGVLPSLQGKEVGVKFANDMIADGHVSVIEAETLQPSHLQGQRNPAHFIDEAQPKERKDEASIASARKIASSIRPEEITSSVTAYTGAPTVNMRGEAIQGNSRSDALRVMWAEYPDQAERYKQYLIDHAEEFGLNAEEIAAMEHPVLVNMLDVSDTDAINLGQYVAQDTESGGTERIKAKNVARKMGSDIRSYANILLRSSDEEASFSELVDKNGVEVLKWMNTKGYITPTQYASAFDSKGNMTAEAKNDLRGILYQSIFQGGNTQLEEQFNAMPAKAQKAILATAYRDYDSPNSERMIAEIQSSIRAYYALSHDRDFVDAKTYKDAKEAMLVWSRQYQMDDVTGESFLPSENFSNFALELAVRYKGNTQSATQNLFNELFDLVQGTKDASLFEEADNTPRTLADAIKETLNIDYNGQHGSNALVGDDTSSQEGRQGSDGDAASGERAESGEGSADSGRGTDAAREQGEVEGKRKVTANVFEMAEEAQKKRNANKKNDEEGQESEAREARLRGNVRGKVVQSLERKIREYEERTGWTKGFTKRQREILDDLRQATDNELNKTRNRAIDENEHEVLDVLNRYARSGERLWLLGEWGITLNEPVSLSKIDELFGLFNRYAEVAALYARVLPIIEQISPTFSFETIRDKDGNVEDDVAGRYSLKSNRIRLNKHLLNSTYTSDVDKARAIVHEMLHAVAQYAVDAKERMNKGEDVGIKIDEGLLEAAQSLIDVYEQIKDNKALKGEYGTTDVHEMISEFANPIFRDKLKKIYIGERSAWQKIKDFFYRIIKKDMQGLSVYAQAKNALDYLIDNFDGNAYVKSRGLSSGTKEMFIGERDAAEDNIRFRDNKEKSPEIWLPEDESSFKGTAISSDNGAKILNNLDNAIAKYENRHRIDTFIGDVAGALGIEAKDRSSKYATFEAMNGDIVTIRISDHNATVSNFDNNGEENGVSIVVSRRPNEGITNDGDAHVVEFFYSDKKLKSSEDKPLVEILKSIKQTLYSGEYKDSTGLAEREEVNERLREGTGAVSDREVSYENDPIAKWQGKPRYYGKRAAAFAERERRRMAQAAEATAKTLGLDVEVVTDAATASQLTQQRMKRRPKAKGWYDVETGKIVVVVPNHVSAGDAVRTVLHEGVAHHGLRELFGDGFDAMLDNIYNNVAPELKARIDAIAERTGVSTSVATEEYLASLAEETNFEYAQRTGWWTKIKGYFMKMLRKLGMPGITLREEITDNELRYLLWRSYQNLVDPNSYLKPLGYLEDVAKQKELKVGEYAENTMATPMAADIDAIEDIDDIEDAEAEEWAEVTMQRIEELEAQAVQLENEIADMEADRDADDESRYDMWEEQIDPLRKQLEDVYAEIEGLYSLDAEAEEMSIVAEPNSEYTSEEQQIIAKAKADGTYLKAPNGADTNLTSEQWVRVRTKNFIRWFGDWMKAYRIEKLRNSTPIDIEFNGEYELNRDSARAWMKDNLRGEYVNADTGEVISVTKVGSNKVTSHGERDEAHLKSITAIPSLIENSIFIEERKNEKGNDKYDSYRYYVCGAKIDGQDYTIKIVIGVKGDSKYYDHRLTRIEKGALIDNLNGMANSVVENQDTNSLGKDTKLLSILQHNSSKIVDENGEPMVVYHGTNLTRVNKGVPFYEFYEDSHFGTIGQAEEMARYGREGDVKKVYDVFLNAKNLKEENDMPEDWVETPSEYWEPIVRKAKEEGYDGIIYKNMYEDETSGDYSYIMFSANQAKSATENNGEYSDENDDIRYRTSEEIEAEYPNWMEGTTTDSGKHSTQVEGTRKTYNKVGDWIEENIGKDVAILDASSGMGYGTADLRERGFNIEDVEPYQSEERKKNNPATYSSYADIDKKYDFIISNAVLNVIPDDWRRDVLHNMAERMNDGGKLFINTRKAGEEKAIKDKIELDTPQEVLVKRNGKIASYQKFFTPQELKAWVESELGDGYIVEVANKKNSGTSGLAAVVVTKKADGLRYREGDDTRLMDALADAYASGDKKAIQNAVNDIIDAMRLEDADPSIGNFDWEKVEDYEGSNPRLLAAQYIVRAKHHLYLDEDYDTEYIKTGIKTVDAPINEVAEGDVDRYTNDFKNERTEAQRQFEKQVMDSQKSHTKGTWLWNGLMSAEDIRERHQKMLEEFDGLLSEYQFDKAAEKLGEIRAWQNAAKKYIDSPYNEIPYVGEDVLIAEIERESGALGVPVRIARSVDELPDEDTRKRAVDGKLKGYYDPRTGEVVLYGPNTNDANDAKRTILHEIVGHKGMRQLIGEERYDKAMVQLMYMLPAEVRDAVLRRAERHGWNAAIAMDEYLAEQAERDVQPTWWGKVNAKIRALLRNMGFNVMLTDADVTYLLWRSRKKLQGDTAFDMATDAILKQAARKSAEAEAWSEQAFKDMEMRDFERNALPSIRHRMGADTNDYEKAMRTLGFKQAEAWQDSMRSLLVFQQALAKASGKDISDFENAYMYENRMSSANLMEMEQYRHMVYNPLLKEIHELEQMGASRESIINYLFAKSGLERNEVFARRDAKKHAEGDAAKEQQLYDKYRQKDYAGLTALTRGDAKISALVDDHSKKKTEYERLEQNKKRGVAVSDADLKAAKKEMNDARKAMITAIEAEAQRMVDEFEAQHNTDNLWDKIRNCTHTTLDISHDAGVMSDEVYNELWNQFQYYIPLRGFAEATAEDVYLYLEGSDSPYNAPIKTAYGRTSLADDPIATIGNMAESAIVEANRNRLKQRFLYMVERHNTDLASISDVWFEYDEKNDEWHTVFAQIPDDATPSEAKQSQKDFEDMMKQLAEQNPGKYANASQQPNIPYRVVKKENQQAHHIIVKRNGKDVVITINGNPRVAQAINGLTNPEQNKGMITQLASWINRNLSANFTMRNPAFMVSNFVRDGFYTNSMVWVKENPAYAWQYNQNWMKCTAQIASLVSRYKRYEKGDTSALDMNNDMDRMFYEFMINGGETGYTVIKSVEDYKGLISGEMKKMEAGAMGTARRVADKIGDVVDTFGRWAEDTSRFAAYMTSRQLGRTITKSIWDAKEVSVNFNKKGSGNRMEGKFKQGNRLNYVLSNMSQLGRNLYVFWNAGVQGLNNFSKAAKKSPAKFTAMAGTYFTLGVIVAAAFSGDDDEDDYYNLPEYVRRNNICFKIGKGKYATLPLPIEIRAIYGLGELAYSYLSGREGLTHGEAVTKTMQQMTQVMPIDMMADGGGAMALVPSAAKPVVEVVHNVDWTGRPIYKEKTPWNQNDPTWTLAFKSTSPELVQMSRLVNEWTNKNTAEGLERPYNRGWADNRYLNNPAVWEHIAEGYLGGVATMFNQTKKTLMMPFNEDLREVRNVPIVSRFVKDAGKEGRSYAARNEYYEAKNIMDSWRNEMSKAKKDILDTSLTEQQRLNAVKLRSSLDEQYSEAFTKWNELDKERDNLEKVLNTDISDQAKDEARRMLDDVMMQMATLVDEYR